ncbi:MAG: phosphopantetheine-binding protein [Victivallaceae bacterium]|jgi:acyl carrier protein|nr:phosphopantetheine-binding protein [Victivallaceae bacterium]MDD3703703.1 phosphopantetheine-binding protein [Victivallaceae bacterium]MDD4318200.1 phosphopantetheine-binding protein [Victivallaceae bacterium]MDD5664045.1 phosphopantetheine-binding protein [Victivallaceae bacterium]NLK83948.1 acyl carrier protein [Lentisphaerota bacterium]
MDEKTAAFRLEFKKNLIDWLQLEDKQPEDIKDEEALFGEGLGLDSLDAVEIVIMLQRKYSIPQSEVDRNRAIFATLASLSDFVQSKLAER